MDNTPNSFDGVILNRLKLGRRYHSGTISRGVDNPFDLYIISSGCISDIPSIRVTTANISTGNIYSISFGHAGSLYVLLHIPDDR
tara:strand:- start:46 stop:300 length:255 start_codon:yes stop_codon:yes gene_type:complete